MTDVELTRALERGEIKDFHHASHLHVAWVYLTETSSVQEAARRMRNTLRRFAAGAGKPEKYHETITLFWVHLLSRAHAASRAERLEDIVHANPQLLEKNFPLGQRRRTPSRPCAQKIDLDQYSRSPGKARLDHACSR
jgi:hypothetical protein